MTQLADILRRAGREYAKIPDGKYFDSSFFDEQAKAVTKHIQELVKNSDGDIDFIIWSLRR